jgi:glucose-6-phosphate 1-dehydrogenase
VLFSLYLRSLLPANAIIYGYARSKLDQADFKKQISQQYLPLGLELDSIPLTELFVSCQFQEGPRAQGERISQPMPLL